MKEIKKINKPTSTKNWIIIWIAGMAGQLCWNVENSWFNSFVYKEIAYNPDIVTWMVGVSAIATTIATLLFGTLSDRIGKRRPFIYIGYIMWGIFTITFGTTKFISGAFILLPTMIVLADAIMSFTGSLGNDAGFNSWTTDITTEENRAQLGGVIAVMPVLATLVGTIGAGAIIQIWGYFTFFVIIGIFIMAIGVFCYFTVHESPMLKPKIDTEGYWHQFWSVFNFKSFVKHKELLWVFLIMAVYFISFNVYFVHILNYIIYTLGYNEANAGLILGVGLIIATLFTFPAAKFIKKGKSPEVILGALTINFVGLFIMTLNGIAAIIIGIISAGAGYIIILQTLTAWVKNLYPDDQRAQFEGVRLIFFVCIPMIIGPMIASPIIKTWGLTMPVDEFGYVGKSPSDLLFMVSAFLSLFTLIPLMFARKYFILNKKKAEELIQTEKK